jgi:hypothetical protein
MNPFPRRKRVLPPQPPPEKSKTWLEQKLEELAKAQEAKEAAHE